MRMSVRGAVLRGHKVVVLWEVVMPPVVQEREFPLGPTRQMMMGGKRARFRIDLV